MVFEPTDANGRHATLFDALPADRESERACLARQLHDVLGEVCIMTAQASGALRRAGKPDDGSTAALTLIESAGRVALADLRQLLDALRDQRETVEDTAGRAGA